MLVAVAVMIVVVAVMFVVVAAVFSVFSVRIHALQHNRKTFKRVVYFSDKKGV
jgi:ABC-type transporter Mla subunit MlaD